VFKAGIAVSRNNDQIGLTIVGDVGDYFKGSPYADKHCFQKLGFDCVFCQCMQLFFRGPKRKTLAHWNVSQIRRVGRGFSYVQQSDSCSKMLCERHRVIKRFPRDPGEIDWHKDTLEFEAGRGKLDRFILLSWNARDFGPDFAAWLTCFCEGVHGLLLIGCVIERNLISLSVREDVQGACEILGLSNEGQLVAFVAPWHASRALDLMRTHSLGARTQVIGNVGRGSPGLVTMTIWIGARRVLDMLSGEKLPRIC
jgi:hypothetical protein